MTAFTVASKFALEKQQPQKAECKQKEKRGLTPPG